MSGAKIDKLVAKAFSKAGKILGYTFTVYRPVGSNYIDPLQQVNSIRTTTMSWTEDKSYEKNPEDVLTFFKLYTDYRGIKAGDIYNNPDAEPVPHGRTFVVTEVNPIRGAVAVQTPDMMDVLRPTSTPTLDVKITNQLVVQNMPCVINFGGAQENKGSMGAVSGLTHVTSGQTHAEVWTWMEPGTVFINDIVVIEGKKYIVNSLSGKHKGTFIKVRALKAGD
jgi:hypothetical protein